MSRIDPAFAYSQARLQARYGARPRAADWSHIAATADLGAMLQVLRTSPLAGWTARLGSRPGIHDIERQARDEWLRRVDEVAQWQPEAWRDGIAWLRWIAYLPALQKLARGGRARAWMRDDPLLGPIVAREPRERAAALRRTPLAPLADRPAGRIAESFERIHRSNLVGMGVLPLRFADGQNAESLGLDGSEVFDILSLNDKLKPQAEVSIKAKKADGRVVEFKATALLNTEVEVNYYRNGGILHTVLRNLVN